MLSALAKTVLTVTLLQQPGGNIFGLRVEIFVIFPQLGSNAAHTLTKPRCFKRTDPLLVDVEGDVLVHMPHAGLLFDCIIEVLRTGILVGQISVTDYDEW